MYSVGLQRAQSHRVVVVRRAGAARESCTVGLVRGEAPEDVRVPAQVDLVGRHHEARRVPPHELEEAVQCGTHRDRRTGAEDKGSN